MARGAVKRAKLSGDVVSFTFRAQSLGRYQAASYLQALGEEAAL